VKPNRTDQSTNHATHAGRKLFSGFIALVLSGCPASAVTLPLTIHAFGREQMGAAVVVGLIPALAAILIISAVVMAFTVATLVTIGRIAAGTSAASSCVDDLFAWMVNPLISLISLTSFKPRRRAAEAQPTPNPLPAVPVAARKEIEAVYWQLKREQDAKIAAAPVEAEVTEHATTEAKVIPPDTETNNPVEPYRARHAKQETTDAEATSDVPLRELELSAAA